MLLSKTTLQTLLPIIFDLRSVANPSQSDYIIYAMLSVTQPAFYALLPITLLIPFLVFIPFTHKARSTKKPNDNTLQHLVSVLVPTRVSWEQCYSQLFNYTKSEKRAVIWISLLCLVQGQCNGLLELRNDQDLQAPISGRLRVSSCRTISLKNEFSWRLRLFFCFSLDKCHLGPVWLCCNTRCCHLPVPFGSVVRVRRGGRIHAQFYFRIAPPSRAY